MVRLLQMANSALCPKARLNSFRRPYCTGRYSMIRHENRARDPACLFCGVTVLLTNDLTHRPLSDAFSLASSPGGGSGTKPPEPCREDVLQYVLYAAVIKSIPRVVEQGVKSGLDGPSTWRLHFDSTVFHAPISMLQFSIVRKKSLWPVISQPRVDPPASRRREQPPKWQQVYPHQSQWELDLSMTKNHHDF